MRGFIGCTELILRDIACRRVRERERERDRKRERERDRKREREMARG